MSCDRSGRRKTFCVCNTQTGPEGSSHGQWESCPRTGARQMCLYSWPGRAFSKFSAVFFFETNVWVMWKTEERENPHGVTNSTCFPFGLRQPMALFPLLFFSYETSSLGRDLKDYCLPYPRALKHPASSLHGWLCNPLRAVMDTVLIACWRTEEALHSLIGLSHESTAVHSVTFFCGTQKKIFWGMFQLFLSIKWKSVGSKTALDPIYYYCIGKTMHKTSTNCLAWGNFWMNLDLFNAQGLTHVADVESLFHSLFQCVSSRPGHNLFLQCVSSWAIPVQCLKAQSPLVRVQINTISPRSPDVRLI